MPREPIPLIRQGGFLEAEKLFVLSYEGRVSEKHYFEGLRKSDFFNNNGLIEMISLKNSKDRSDPINVKKLLQEAKRKYRFKNTDEFWLVIDRDDWELIHKHNFVDLVSDCKAENNFYLAMSNPCFEIWLVLHLKGLEDFSEEVKQKMFTNGKVNSKKNYLEKVLSDILEEIHGRGYNKRPDPSIFLPKTQTAINRAQALNNTQEEYPSGFGSHIYKLVEKLLAK